MTQPTERPHTVSVNFRLIYGDWLGVVPKAQRPTGIWFTTILLCPSKVREYFKIPRTCKRIQVVVSDTPPKGIKNYYLAEFSDYKVTLSLPEQPREKWREYLYSSTYTMMKHIFGYRTVYVYIKY